MTAGRRVTGLMMTFGVTLFSNISHPASVSSPRCGRVSPRAVRKHYPNPWSQSFFGITETASDSRGRHGCPPLWPSSTGDWGRKAKLSSTLWPAGSLFWPCKGVVCFTGKIQATLHIKPLHASLGIDEDEGSESVIVVLEYITRMNKRYTEMLQVACNNKGTAAINNHLISWSEENWLPMFW